MTLNKRKNPIIFLTFLTLGFLDGKANPSQSNPGLFPIATWRNVIGHVRTILKNKKKNFIGCNLML